MNKNIYLLLFGLLIIIGIGNVNATTNIGALTGYDDMPIYGYSNDSNVTSYAIYNNGVQIENTSNKVLLLCSFDTGFNCSSTKMTSLVGVNISPNAGKYDGGFVSYGNSNYFQVDNTSKYFADSGNLTISFWMKYSNFNSTTAGAAWTVISGLKADGGWDFQVPTNNSRTFILTFKNSTGASQYVYIGHPVATWDEGVWYWVGLTFTNSTNINNVRLYRDGILATSGYASTNFSLNKSMMGTMQIGGWSYTSFNGTLDDIELENNYYDDNEMYTKYYKDSLEKKQQNEIWLHKNKSYINNNITFYSTNNSVLTTNSTVSIIARPINISVNNINNLTTKLKYGFVTYKTPLLDNASYRQKIIDLNMDYASLLQGQGEGADTRCYNGTVFNFSACDRVMNRTLSAGLKVWADQFGYPTGIYTSGTTCPNITNDKYGRWYGGIIRHFYNMDKDGTWNSTYGYDMGFKDIRWTHVGEPSLACYWDINSSANIGKMESETTPLIFQIHNQTVRNLTDIGVNGVDYYLGYDTVMIKDGDIITGSLNNTQWINLLNMTPRPAFVAYHQYANQVPLNLIPIKFRYVAANSALQIQPMLNWSYYAYYESDLWARSVMNLLNYSNTTEINKPEWNVQTNQAYTNQNYTGIFMVTSLYHMLKANEVTTNILWSGGAENASVPSEWAVNIMYNNLTPKDSYYVLKNYKYCFPNGTSIKTSSSSDNKVLTMWGYRNGKYCGVIINQREGTVAVTINLSNINVVSFNNIPDLNSSILLSNNNDNIFTTQVAGYDYTFFEQNDLGYAPNILSIYDINSNNYFDRIVKSVYGNIPRLPDNQNNYQTSFLITPSAVNQSMTVQIPLRDQINAYSDGWANSTAIVPSTMRVCYSSIYGGTIGCVAYNYTN